MSLSLDVQKRHDIIPTKQYDVVVVGAGPYGLSAAAHLQAQKLKVAVFGKPMCYWRQHMSKGMLLRSFWWASNLSDPQKKYTMERYFRCKGLQPVNPLPIETFIDYSLWFQEQAVPNVDETYVSMVERKGGRFVITLEDGRVVSSTAVVMAPGLQYYKYCPEEYAHLPTSLISHTADHSTLEKFSGKEVAIIGGGQSALETAALLNEQEAKVHVLIRRAIHWIPLANSKTPALLRELRAPKAGMGSGWLNLVLEKYPYALQRFPHNTRDYVLSTRHGPAGSPWLKPRLLNKVTLREHTSVKAAVEVNGRVQLTLTDGETLEIDHVMLATGYKADVRQLPMLSSSLCDYLQTYMQSPVLNNWFESNIPGLFFVGFTAARSFGPFYRFVVGTEAAARRVTHAVARLVTVSVFQSPQAG